MRTFHRPGRCFRTGWILFLCLCFLSAPAASGEILTENGAAYRLPGPAVFSEEETARIREAGAIDRDPVLDAAFTLLEEGNPFLARYNLITGAQVEARLQFGIPYLWGGWAESHVFAKEPDYVVQAAWTNSRIYYRAGNKYLYGFDCYGLIAWIWKQTQAAELPTIEDLFRNTARQIPGPSAINGAKYTDPETGLQVGDLLVMEHPGHHIAMYAGTLRMYGYTEEEVPELTGELDTPLVIHSTVNGSIADRFAWLISNGIPKYRVATVTDGGVCVSLLCDCAEDAPMHVFQQKQDTYYYLLPDGTWLTVLAMKDADRTCWLRIRTK